MASSNASAVLSREPIPKSENAHRRQGQILTEISGCGKAISNCQYSNHIERTDKKTPVLLTYLHRQKTYLMYILQPHFKRKKNSPFNVY